MGSHPYPNCWIELDDTLALRSKEGDHEGIRGVEVVRGKDKYGWL